MFDFLVPHIWWIAALICSFSTAAAWSVGQYSKLDGNLMIFWRGVFPCLFTTPFLFFIELPTSPYFYLLALLTAFIASYTDVRNMNGSIKYGAGTKLRIRPYALWIIFLGWFVLSPEYRENFLSHPTEAIGICIGLVFVALATSYMSRSDVSRSALIFFFPTLLGAAALDLLNKTAMELSPVLGGVLMYAWMQGIIITSVCFFKQYISKDKAVSLFFERRTLLFGCLIGCLFSILILSKNTAMTFTENPAYVSAIIMMSPIWVAIFYRLKGEKDEVNEFAGLLVVASSIMLVLLASNM